MGRIGINFNRRLLVDRGRLAIDESVPGRADDSVPREFHPTRPGRGRRDRRLRENGERFRLDRRVLARSGILRFDPVPDRGDVDVEGPAGLQVLEPVMGRIGIKFNRRLLIDRGRLAIDESVSGSADDSVP